MSAAQASQGLETTQLRAIYKYLDGAENQISAMRDLRTAVEGAGVGPGRATYPFMFSYIFFEQFAIIRPEAFTNLGLALVAVFIITSVIIASIHASAMVIMCVVMVDIDILGLMHMWGLTIDSVTIINLVLAVGLSVDYSAHVAHAFVVAKGTRQERADTALAEMGTAVLHGALSTFCAVVILSTSQSYIFVIFFKQFFGICIFGAAHGLIFLPVMLSLVGPDAIQVDVRASANFPVAGSKGGLNKDAPDSIEMGIAPTPETPPPSVPASPPGSISGPISTEPPAPLGARASPVMRAWEAKDRAEEA